MTRDLIRRVIHYPRVTLPSEDSGHAPDLVRRIDVRPGRFIVTNPVITDQSPLDWQIPRELLEEDSHAVVGPLRPALHLARVEDVDEDKGTIHVSVWEVPNGRSGTAVLTREQVGQDVEMGDTLRIYTWLDIPLEQRWVSTVDRIHMDGTFMDRTRMGRPPEIAKPPKLAKPRPQLRVVAIPRPALTPEEKAALAALLAETSEVEV